MQAKLDGGINYLETSACYDISEKLIGCTTAHRHGEYVLATEAEGKTASPAPDKFLINNGF